MGERESFRNIGASWIRANATSASFEGRVGFRLNTGYNDGPTGANNPLPANTVGYATTNDCRRLSYTSGHTNGVQFLFADGSVRFASNTAETNSADNFCTFNLTLPTATANNFLMQKLQHPADGLVASPEF